MWALPRFLLWLRLRVRPSESENVKNVTGESAIFFAAVQYPSSLFRVLYKSALYRSQSVILTWSEPST